MREMVLITAWLRNRWEVRISLSKSRRVPIRRVSHQLAQPRIHRPVGPVTMYRWSFRLRSRECIVPQSFRGSMAYTSSSVRWCEIRPTTSRAMSASAPCAASRSADGSSLSTRWPRPSGVALTGISPLGVGAPESQSGGPKESAAAGKLDRRRARVAPLRQARRRLAFLNSPATQGMQRVSMSNCVVVHCG
jgi:hypothetical protein